MLYGCLDVETDYEKQYKELLTLSAAEHKQIVEDLEAERKRIIDIQRQKQQADKQCTVLAVCWLVDWLRK